MRGIFLAVIVSAALWAAMFWGYRTCTAPCTCPPPGHYTLLPQR